MNVDDVRELALSFAGVSESRPFAPDRVVFKAVANKIGGHAGPDAVAAQDDVDCN